MRHGSQEGSIILMAVATDDISLGWTRDPEASAEAVRIKHAMDEKWTMTTILREFEVSWNNDMELHIFPLC